MIRRIDIAAVALFLLSGLLAPAKAEIRNPDSFVYAIVGDVDSLDPHWQYDGNSHFVQWQLYETLVGYEGSSVKDFEPLLATVVPDKKNGFISSDGLVYRFPLRKGVLFHDGSPLAPEDVRYSFLRYLLTDRDGGSSGLLLEPLLGLHSTRGPDGKPDPAAWELSDKAVRLEGGALVLRLKKPFAPLLSLLAGFCPVVSRSWTVAHGGWDGSKDTWARYNNPPKEGAALYDGVNGTGPFMLERWDRREKRLVLARNPRYWRSPAAMKHVVIMTVDEFATRRLMLAVGDADAAVVERQFASQLAGLEGVALDDGLPFLEVHNAFVMNQKVNVEGNRHVGSGQLDGNGIPADFFKDLDVRKGFAHGFDYDGYISGGYLGKAQRSRGPIPAGVPGHNPRQPVVPFDLAKAAEHLQKAHGGRVWEKGFRLTASYMQGRADRQLACEILKKNIESLNPRFAIDVQGIQWSTYLSAFVAGKLPLVNARWAMDYPDPHNAVHPFLHSSGYYAKAAGYSSPRADAAIEAAVGELDPDKRRALYHELQSIARTDLPALFTVDTYHLRARRSWVKGWEHNPILLLGYLYPVTKGEQ